jgi:hypothetical protein
MKFRNQLDAPNNIGVELIEFSRRNPIFPVNETPDRVNLIVTKKLRPHIKPKHIPGKSGVFVLRIPIARDLRRIFRVEYWIKERLFRQPRRKLTKSSRSQQIEFRLSNRPIKSYQITRHTSSILEGFRCTPERPCPTSHTVSPPPRPSHPRLALTPMKSASRLLAPSMHSP